MKIVCILFPSLSLFSPILLPLSLESLYMHNLLILSLRYFTHVLQEIKKKSKRRNEYRAILHLLLEIFQRLSLCPPRRRPNRIGMAFKITENHCCCRVNCVCLCIRFVDASSCVLVNVCLAHIYYILQIWKLHRHFKYCMHSYCENLDNQIVYEASNLYSVYIYVSFRVRVLDSILVSICTSSIILAVCFFFLFFQSLALDDYLKGSL